MNLVSFRWVWSITQGARSIKASYIEGKSSSTIIFVTIRAPVRIIATKVASKYYLTGESLKFKTLFIRSNIEAMRILVEHFEGKKSTLVRKFEGQKIQPGTPCLTKSIHSCWDSH